MAFLPWRLPAGGRLFSRTPRRLSAKSERCAPTWAERSDAAALDQILGISLVCVSPPAVSCGCSWHHGTMGVPPRACRLFICICRTALPGLRQGTAQGWGKGGNKGNSTHNLTLKQLSHLASQAKALQSSAAALGWAISFTPRARAKVQTRATTTPATAIKNRLPSGCFRQDLQEDSLRSKKVGSLLS